jgi:glucokinase
VAAQAIGVDLGGTKILAGIVRRDGTIGETLEVATPTHSQEELVTELERVVDRLLGTNQVAALGFGVPCQVDQRRGVATGAVNIPLVDVPLRDRMTSRFALPTGIENDGNAATFAEWRLGAGRGTDDLVMLTLGTGVGGGLVIDGAFYRGWAELGHIVIDYDGPPCQGLCTGRGHVESLCSGTAANRIAQEVLGGDASSRELIAQARDGVPEAVDGIAGLGRHLGAALGSLANIFDSKLALVGGGFGLAAFDLIVGPARELVAREALPPADEELRIEQAELGEEAGLLGAGLVAFEALGAGP